MNLKLVIILMMGVFQCMALAGQQFSNRGRDFWTGYGLHNMMEIGQTNGQEMVLYLSVEEPANVTVTIKGISATTVRNYSIPANTVITTEPMPKSGTADCRLYDYPPSFGGQGSDRLFDRSIHIESDVPIVAYAHISGAASSGATMLMPVESWGYHYASVNSQQKLINAGGLEAYSWLFVVANHDNTVVEITPSVPLRNGRPANVPFTATLNKGQIYQVVAAAINGANGHELTGTIIKSIPNGQGGCYPVGVFAGSSGTAITCDGSNSGYADNLIQQIFPIHAWGKLYLTAPFSSTTGATVFNESIFRVAVSDPATVVKRNGIPLTNLQRNFYYEFLSSTADVIEADKPVLVTQYIPSMPGGGIDPGCKFFGDGDPEMVYLSPMEQAINRIGFYRNTDANISVNYLTLIIPTPGLNSLNIDGSTNFTHVYPHPNMPGYSVVVQRWDAARAQTKVYSDSAFTAVTYGLGFYDSYAYNAGTYINNLNGKLSLRNTEASAGTEHPFTCTFSPVELSVLMSYEPTRLVWHLSELTHMTPNADVVQTNPTYTGTVVHNGITYYKYTLPGTYQFTQGGTFRFAISSTHPSIPNCNNTERLLLDVPVKDFSQAALFKQMHSNCLPDLVTFEFDPANMGNFEADRWLWTFHDGRTGTLDTAQYLYTASGNFDVTLRVVSEEGCVDDTTVTVAISSPSGVTGSVSPSIICENGSVNFTGTVTGAAPVTDWYWDFGNGQTSTEQSPANIVYDHYGSYTIKMVGKTGGCTTDTVQLSVLVNDNPSPLFAYPAGCLPVTGLVNFQSQTSTADGSAITTHAWDFGDPNATPANPNTSSDANPSHNYSVGEYNIRYTVTSDKGCTNDTVVHASFNPAPALRFDPLPDVCENAASLSVAFATVTNGVSGTGIYKGPGVTPAGSFTAAQAGPGMHFIWYVFTTTAGCIDSISAPVNVLPAPQAAFNITEDACLGSAVTLTDQSTTTGAPITAWEWQFGDGSTIRETSNAAFTKNYTADGVYTVSLVVIDSRGCASNAVMKATTIHPIPVAAFDLPDVVCMPRGEAQFINRSTVKGNETLNYEWNFGDGSAVSTDADPVHHYITAGNYPVVLTVTSAFGCTHTSTHNLSSFAQQPVAAFKVAPDQVCQGTDVFFTDQSSSASGPVNGWNWRFSDGTTATSRHVTKRFTSAGLHYASLVATNSAGCDSDSLVKEVLVHVQPVVDAGPSFMVAEGTVVTFNPQVNDPNLVFSWTPPAELNDASLLRPSFRATHDQTFRLTASDAICSASDTLTVKILRPVKIPNAFSPNGDGINDTWIITNLTDYRDNTVEVFNRYGQRVFYSLGYTTPWDGRYKGNPVPAGVYYYVINLKNGFGKLTGSITVLR
jgi:FOG: PKD repeat